MKKVFIFLLLIVACLPIFSKNDIGGHDLDMMLLFFNNRLEVADWRQEIREIEALADSIYICLDFHNNPSDLNKCNEALKRLVRYGIINENQYSTSQLITPGGNTHQKYTHMGWHWYDDERLKIRGDNKYIPQEYGYYEAWYLRREILQRTVNSIFDFNYFDERKSLSQCSLWSRSYSNLDEHPSMFSYWDRSKLIEVVDNGTGSEKKSFKPLETKSGSMAAIFYYVHILGDWEVNSESTEGNKIDLKDLQKELLFHLENVFGSSKVQKSTRLYDELKSYNPNATRILKEMHNSFQDLLTGESFFVNTNLCKEIETRTGISYE